jgi:hypothetical protein
MLAIDNTTLVLLKVGLNLTIGMTIKHHALRRYSIYVNLRVSTLKVNDLLQKVMKTMWLFFTVITEKDELELPL